jgi:hypothetical protein
MTQKKSPKKTLPTKVGKSAAKKGAVIKLPKTAKRSVKPTSGTGPKVKR